MTTDPGPQIEEQGGPGCEAVRLDLPAGVQDLTGGVAELPLVGWLAGVACLLEGARNESAEGLFFVCLQGGGLPVDDDREGQLLGHGSTILASLDQVKKMSKSN